MYFVKSSVLLREAFDYIRDIPCYSGKNSRCECEVNIDLPGDSHLKNGEKEGVEIIKWKIFLNLVAFRKKKG